MLASLLTQGGILVDLAWSFLPDWIRLHSLALPALIFLLRTLTQTLGTLRVLSVAGGRRLAAWILAAMQAVTFVATLAGLLNELAVIESILAYALGYAMGDVLGITIEAALAPGHSLLRIVSRHRGNAVAEALRAAGHGVTEVPGLGHEGMVSLLICYTPRREVRQALEITMQGDPEAFVSVENVRELTGGWAA
jgi:uncharacterized protein YebE (UPF0316 family)